MILVVEYEYNNNFNSSRESFLCSYILAIKNNAHQKH